MGFVADLSVVSSPVKIIIIRKPAQHWLRVFLVARAGFFFCFPRCTLTLSSSSSFCTLLCPAVLWIILRVYDAQQLRTINALFRILLQKTNTSFLSILPLYTYQIDVKGEKKGFNCTQSFFFSFSLL